MCSLYILESMFYFYLKHFNMCPKKVFGWNIFKEFILFYCFNFHPRICVLILERERGQERESQRERQKQRDRERNTHI